MLINKLFDFLNQRSPITIQTPWVGAIGNCAEEIYFGLLRAKRENKKVLFLFPHDLFWIFTFSKKGKGINSELIKVESKYRFLPYDHWLTRCGNWFVTAMFCLSKFLGIVVEKVRGRPTSDDYKIPHIASETLWCPVPGTPFSPNRIIEQNWSSQINSFIDVNMPPESFSKAVKTRCAMGLPHDCWYVCLHVREGGYYDYDEGKAKQVRNSDIGNYLLAIQYITDNGGWVVRMGDDTMTPLPDMAQVIDYPHTPFKSHLMDIYLIQECRFYIGSQSGVWDVSALYQKPILMPNMAEWLFTYPQRKGDLGLIKHIYSRSQKRYLSLQECQEAFLQHQFKILFDDDFEFHDNTSDEILELVREFMAQGNTKGDTDLQRQWNQKRILDGYEILNVMDIDPAEKYRIGSRIEGYTGNIGHGFLEKYWNDGSIDRSA